MERFKQDFPFITVLLLASVFIFYNLWAGSLVNSDDAIYAEIIKRILKTGNWLDLYWLDYRYLTKPPLFFWMGAFSSRIFSLSEFSLRLPSALLGFFSILLVWSFAREMAGRTSAYISAMTLLGFELFLNLSHRVMTDIPLTFFVVLSIYSFWRSELNSKYLYLGWISAGLAFLVKSLVFLPGLLVPLLYFTFKGKMYLLLKRESVVGFLSMLAITLPWQIYNTLLLGERFTGTFIGNQVIKHYSGQGLSYFNKPFFYYFRRFYDLDFPILMMFVASLLILIFLRRQVEFKKIGIVLIWVAFYFLTFSVSKTKLDHYIVGAYPAIAIIIGVALGKIFPGMNFSLGKFFKYAVSILVTFLALGNFLPYLNASGWHVDSSGDIKRLVKHYNGLAGEPDILYAYQIYIPAPVFYSKTKVLEVEPDRRRFDLVNGVAEFRNTDSVANFSPEEYASLFVAEKKIYSLIREDDFEKLRKSLSSSVLMHSGPYVLISNLYKRDP